MRRNDVWLVTTVYFHPHLSLIYVNDMGQHVIPAIGNMLLMMWACL